MRPHEIETVTGAGDVAVVHYAYTSALRTLCLGARGNRVGQRAGDATCQDCIRIRRQLPTQIAIERARIAAGARHRFTDRATKAGV